MHIIFQRAEADSVDPVKDEYACYGHIAFDHGNEEDWTVKGRL